MKAILLHKVCEHPVVDRSSPWPRPDGRSATWTEQNSLARSCCESPLATKPDNRGEREPSGNSPRMTGRNQGRISAGWNCLQYSRAIRAAPSAEDQPGVRGQSRKRRGAKRFSRRAQSSRPVLPTVSR